MSDLMGQGLIPIAVFIVIILFVFVLGMCVAKRLFLSLAPNRKQLKKLLLSLLQEIYGSNNSPGAAGEGPNVPEMEMFDYGVGADGFPTPMKKPVSPDDEIEENDEPVNPRNGGYQ